jgi:hypothetical protein
MPCQQAAAAVQAGLPSEWTATLTEKHISAQQIADLDLRQRGMRWFEFTHDQTTTQRTRDLAKSVD